MEEHKSIILEKKGQVATITLTPVARWLDKPGPEIHWELGTAFSHLREDNSIRVIVLTGSEGQFMVPAPKDFYHTGKMSGHLTDPTGAWRTFTGIVRCHQAMAESEKPIVAKVNGDAIGFGQSLAFASDIIVADEKAVFIDHHMGGTFTSSYGGQVKEGGHAYSSLPGDGGLALVPLFMSPCRAKEYLMLSRQYTAAELAKLGIINYAVPASGLDAMVDDLVKRLLERGAYALAWAKRVANKRVVEQLNLALDAGVAYEMVGFLQLEKMGGVEKKTLD